MKKPIVKAILGFIIPAAAILLLGGMNIWYGLAAFAAYMAIVLYTSRVLVYTMIGSRHYGRGNINMALKWYKRAHESKKAGVKTSVSYAYLLLKNTELKKSEEILQKLLKEHAGGGDIPYIQSILGLALWKKGELDDATSMLEEAIKSYKTTSIYGSLGYLYLLQGDPEKALQFNLEAHEYNSADKIILDNLGQNYYLLGNYEKAIEIFEPLVAKAPAFPEPYYNYGLVLEKLGETEKALDMMKMALTYKFPYLSSITKEEVESKIQEISDRMK